MQFTSPVLIGRDREIELLNRRLTEAAHGRGGALFVLGDPGVGKSRLTGECFDRAAESGMTTLRGRASGVSADIPFKPLSEALLALARTQPPPGDPALASYLPALTTLVPEWRANGITGHLESVVVLAEAVLRLLAAIGKDRGCLLVLEDLHDADADTLAVVEYLADHLAGTPALLVANLRGHPSPARTLADALGRRRGAVLLDLAPLPAPQLGLLAAACLDTSPERLPDRLLTVLERDTDGVPFVVEELLGAMADVGALTHDGQCWRLRDTGGVEVPTTLVRGTALRAERLSPSARDLLHMAAACGSRFPIPVIQEATGSDAAQTLAFLRAGTAERLITPDESSGDWYAFRHALTAEALLAALIPAERAHLARRAADAVERLHPGLPDEWCQVAATLRLASGDRLGAARLLAEAGGRLLDRGAADVAATLLDRAHALLGDDGPADLCSAVLKRLLHALTEGGRADRALTLATDLPLAGQAMSIRSEIDLRTRLAWVAAETGGTADGTAHVAAVRRLLEASPDQGQSAAIDVIEAQLIVPDHGVLRHGSRRMAAAERLARRAAEVAERLPLPEVACHAWERLAMLSRVRGFAEPDRCLTRVLSIADAHGLRLWKLRAMLRLAANHALRTGEQEPLREVDQAAGRAGAISLVHATRSSLVMTQVLCGQYEQAQELAERCLETTVRLGHTAYTQYLLLAQATLAAHQARPDDMRTALADFRRWGGDDSLHTPVVHGLCMAVCALLEEDRERAADLLAQARDWEDSHPTIYYLTGRYGLGVLLDALSARVTMPAWEVADKEPAGELGWNRHFLHLARAVLLGRAGAAQAAADAVAQARAAARPYPMAAHLGLRLVAEAALADGWGEPLVWLRTAEEYFHQARVPAVTNACRALLRAAGAAVAQRRKGRERVPGTLRELGVTVREYEVLVLVAERRGNIDIGRRLFISPRTVEKHVASLLLKTGTTDRPTLTERAADLLG
jgi:DNA-binding CsgD family transcriptional regulator